MKKEYIFAALLAGIILLLSNAYLISGMQPKDDLSFLGRRVINSQDTYTYVAFTEQVRQGKVLLANLYTTEPQTPTLIRPSYMMLGWLARVVDVPSIAAYHIGRIVFSMVFCFVLYLFIRQFFKSSKKRILAFAITLSSTGFGFIFGGLFTQSVDLWIPESNTFLSLQEAPHFILSQTLMLISFLLILKGWSYKSKDAKVGRSALFFILAFLPLVLLGFEHPYNLLVCAGTVVIAGCVLWIEKRIVRKILIWSVVSVVLGTVIGNLYQIIETLRNPTLGSWAAQSNSPSPVNFILGYGLLVVFALFGLEKYLRDRKNSQILLISWIVATVILLYSPVFFQRRLSEGLHIPVAILATEGIIICATFFTGFVIQKAKKYAEYSMVILIVCIMTLGTLVGVSNDVLTITSESKASYYYYLLNSEIKAMVWLRDNTDDNHNVLANWFYGNVIPGISGRKVFIGHKAQTKDFYKKLDLINEFILEKNATKAYNFLKKHNISYVYLGANDSMLTYGFKPEKKPYLINVYDFDDVRIYKVR